MEITTDTQFNPQKLKIGDTVKWLDPRPDEANHRYKITGVEGRFASKVFLEPIADARVVGMSRSANLLVRA